MFSEISTWRNIWVFGYVIVFDDAEIELDLDNLEFCF